MAKASKPQASTPASRRHGFVDESFRHSSGYLVCAAVVPAHDLATLRTSMRALRVPGSERVHMKSDGRNRTRILSEVVNMPLEVRMYVAPAREVSQRQARTAILDQMVPDLAGLGVSNLYLESCDQDRQDTEILSAARKRTGLTADAFYFDHRSPSNEPLLWIPDVIAWAWGRDRSWRRQVERLVTGVVELAA